MSHTSLKQIQDVTVGESVIADDGSTQRVTEVLEYDCDEDILELEINNGIVIRCTKDPEFFTDNRGCGVAAGKLEAADTLSDVADKVSKREQEAHKIAD